MHLQPLNFDKLSYVAPLIYPQGYVVKIEADLTAT